MNRLISLELKRSRFHSYHLAVLIITAVMLGMMYLLALIPRMDPSDSDVQMLQSYSNLIGLENLLFIAVFLIFSAVISGKLIVEEYSGKRAILLFSYPVARQRILSAKLLLVYGYTLIAMLLSGAVTFGIFFLTETVYPLCPDQMTITTVLDGLGSLALYSMTACAWGMAALWIGFRKQSVTVTMVSAVIIAVVICQIMGMTVYCIPLAAAFLAAGLIAAALAWMKLKNSVMKMEV